MTIHRFSALAALVVATGPPSKPAGVDGAVVWSDPPFAVPADVKDDLRFGTLTVPRRHGDPSSGSFRIAFVVLRSRAIDPAPDPVVFVPGGPGMAVLEPWAVAAARAPRIALLREHRNFVIVEPRGHGLSEPRSCPELDALLPALVSAPHSAVDAVKRCRQTLERGGLAPADLNAIEAAYDLEDLRRALGATSLNLLAVSYGTRIAAEAMRRVPSAIRSAALLGPVPPDLSWQRLRDSVSAARLDILVARCARQPSCAGNFPRIDEELRLLFQAAERSKPALDAAGDERLDSARLASGLAALLHDRALAAGVPALIHALSEHGLERIASEARRFETLFVDEVAAVAFLSFRCADADVGDRASGWLRAVCPLWLAETPEQAAPSMAPIPSLVVAGELDPRTPPELGHALTAGLPASRYVELPWTGHDYGIECANEIEREFFERPDHPPGARCLESIAPIEFAGPVVPNRIVSGTARLLSAYPLATSAGAGVLLLMLLGPLAQRIVPTRRPGRPARTPGDTYLAGALRAATTVLIIGIAAALAAGSRESPLVPLLGAPEAYAPVAILPGVVLALALVASIRSATSREAGRMPISPVSLAGAWLTLAACVALARSV